MKKLGIWNPGRELWENPAGQIDLFSAHSEPYSDPWPSWGTMRNGAAYELQTSVPPTLATEFLSSRTLLPTPIASDAKGTGPADAARDSVQLRQVSTQLLPTPQAHDATAGKTPEQVAAMRARGFGVSNLNETFSLLGTPRVAHGMNASARQVELHREGIPDGRLETQLASLLPTPTTQESQSGPSQANRATPPLNARVLLLPTPDVTSARRSDEAHAAGKNQVSIHDIQNLLPTPVAKDSGGTAENHLRKKPGRSQVTSLQILTESDLLQTGGRISPPSNDGKQ